MAELQTIAILIPGVVQVGALLVPVFGVFAALGLGWINDLRTHIAERCST